jgi:hypothetical protein
MQRSAIRWVVLASLGLAVLVGCAVGTDPDVGSSESDVQPAEGGTDDETSVKLPPSSAPGDDEDAGSGDDDGGADDGGSTDAGTVDSGADGGGGGGDGGTSCASPNVCAASTDLGTVSGDTGSGVKSASGSSSQWFKIRISEDDSSVFGSKMQVKAELTSAPGTNFDLFLYLAGNGSALSCSGVTKSSTTTGFDTASWEWGEGAFSNGSDDDRNVTVEVRWASGTCAPTSKWSLTVRGNKN